MADKFSKYAVKKEDKFSKYRAPAASHQQEEAPEESTGFGGVASDAINKTLQFPVNFALGALNLPEEAYGAGKQAITEPSRFSQNIGAGFGQLGHNILSAPGGLRDYLAKKELIPQSTPSLRLPESILPKEFNYADALGAKGHHAGDELIRSLPSQLASAPLATKIFEGISEIPLTKGAGARPLQQAKKLASERGISGLNISKDIFKEVKDFLPKNLPTKRLLESAKKGDYDKLFTLQSDLGASARQLTKSASGAERLHGFQANDLRQRLLQGMRESLSKSGHEDIAKLMGKGQKKYAQALKLNEKVYKPIKKAAGYTGLGALGYEAIKKLNI